MSLRPIARWRTAAGSARARGCANTRTTRAGSSFRGCAPPACCSWLPALPSGSQFCSGWLPRSWLPAARPGGRRTKSHRVGQNRRPSSALREILSQNTGPSRTIRASPVEFTCGRRGARCADGVAFARNGGGRRAGGGPAQQQAARQPLAAHGDAEARDRWPLAARPFSCGPLFFSIGDP